jgi:hypothetical protein
MLHPTKLNDQVPASLAVSVLGALVSYAAIQIRATARLDDSLDVFSCHGLAGVAGAPLSDVFTTQLANPAGGDGWLATQPEWACSSSRSSPPPQAPWSARAGRRAERRGQRVRGGGGAAEERDRLALDDLEQRRQLEGLVGGEDRRLRRLWRQWAEVTGGRRGSLGRRHGAGAALTAPAPLRAVSRPG